MGIRLIGLALLGLVGATAMVAGKASAGGAVCVTGVRDGVPVFLLTGNESLVQVALADPSEPPSTRAPLPPGWRRRGESPPAPRSVRVSGANGPIANRIGSDSTVSLVFWKWIGDAIVEGPVVNCSTIVESPRFDSDDYLLGGMLRPDSLWIDNQPTIDVFDTWYKQFRASTLQPGLNLGTVVDFLNTMPTFEEWATDCRPATERSERWLEANRAGYLNWAMNSLTRQLRIECRLWLAIHATELRRGGGLTPAVPDEARQALLSVGCRAGSNPHRQFPRWIVAGHFRDSVDPQYATICQIDGSWRVLVVTMTPAIVVEELSRLVGSGAGWSIQSLPPEFFKWTSSGEFNQIFIGQQPVERPAHDILLLMAPSQAYSAIQLAFFRTPQGWVQVGVECCNWPR